MAFSFLNTFPPTLSARGSRPNRGQIAALPLLAGLLTVSLPAQPASELDPLVITVARTPGRTSELPVTVDVFDSSLLANTPGMMLDDVLKSSAAFSLFRRTGSLMANPTAQGVSLRNVAPSGASRTLVLLDGVPLNDPFGGWVAWTKLPRLNLAGAEIVRGGGSSAWGSAALGGTIQLLTSDHLANQPGLPADGHAAHGGAVVAEVGDFSTHSVEVLARGNVGSSHLQATARSFASDGFWRVDESDRGAIDRRAGNEHHVASLAWRHSIDADTTVGLSARFYQEDRGNGTPLQQNHSEEAFISATADGRVFQGQARWTAAAYAQTQEFRSMFTSVSDDRSAEAPVLDQFAVPSDAAGGSATLTWSGDASATSTVGADVRWVRGETREAFFRQNDVFTRHRFAGGEQHVVGAFAQHNRTLAPNLRAHVGGRVDFWKNRDGHRRELERATNAILRNESFDTRDGHEFSPSAGLVWQATESVRLRGTLYRAFRIPTLNELYRPFRVGDVITEANPELTPETLEGAELGLHVGGPRASFALTGFINELQDAVANVTIGTGPGQVPGVGFVPAGGVGRQRRNLDELRVRGIEVTARWSPIARLDLKADYLFSDSIVTDGGSSAANLNGRRLPQVPRHTLVTRADWTSGAWRLGLQARHVSTAFENDTNTLKLAPATTVDLRVSRSFGTSEAGTIFIQVENLFDETVEAGRDADGRVDLGASRFAHAGFRWNW